MTKLEPEALAGLTLEPCPFCGEVNDLFLGYRKVGDEEPFAIDCLGCGTRFTPRDGVNAKAAWNRRPAQREAEASGEGAEGIARRWANWIIDESADRDDVADHDAGKRKVRAERDVILSALANPQPVGGGEAWVIRVANGNVRFWSRDEVLTKRKAAEWGLEAKEETLSPRPFLPPKGDVQSALDEIGRRIPDTILHGNSSGHEGYYPHAAVKMLVAALYAGRPVSEGVIRAVLAPLRSEDDERHGRLINGTLDDAERAILFALTSGVAENEVAAA